MDQFKIPKYEIAAEAHLTGLPAREVSLHLAERAERHPGRERIEDLLNGSKLFLPVTVDDGCTAFLERNALLYLKVSVGDLEREYGTAEAAVELAMEDGRTLRGRVSYRLPRERGRLQDYLNQEERFLALLGDGEVHYVNKRRIVWIRPTHEALTGDHGQD